MKKILSVLFIVLCPLTVAQAGTLIAIGGALEPNNEAIYQAIIADASTLGEPLICVLGTASSDPQESAETYIADFDSYGAETVYVDITEENAATSTTDNAVVEQLSACNGFFFVGGDQRRITAAFLPEGNATPASEAMNAQFAAGAVIAGTSAGLAMMSETMISGGSSVDSLLGGEDAVTLEPGLGFITNAILDQHFLADGRFGRLYMALQETDLKLGVGVDENTALRVDTEGLWHVLGESSIAVLETSEDGAFISLLSTGDTFDPTTGDITILAERESIAEPYYEAGEIFAVDAFAPNVLTNLLTQLVDSPETSASGLGFTGSGQNIFISEGVRVRFAKTDETAGYWGRAEGADYSIVRVEMTTEPVKVYVVPDKNAK
ncbi:MAG: cyanophycinase [Trueperaceae bacterium]